MRTGAISIATGLLTINSKNFENGKSLAIVGFGLFVYVSIFIYFPRNREFPRGKGPFRGYAIAVLWGRWILLAIGIFGVIKMLAS